MTGLGRLRSDVRAFALAIEQPLAEQAGRLALARTPHDRRRRAAPERQETQRAVAALWWAYRSPDQRALVLSADEDASRRLLAEGAAGTIHSPLLAGSITDENLRWGSLSDVPSGVRGLVGRRRLLRQPHGF